jgi:hypothetical protein
MNNEQKEKVNKLNKEVSEQINYILDKLSNLSEDQIKSMAVSEDSLKVANMVLEYKRNKENNHANKD